MQQHDRYLDHADQLCRLALLRLPRMVDPASGLVVFRVQDQGLTPLGTSVRYTAITALGVGHALTHGHECALDLARLFTALDVARPMIDNPGDLALTLWATAQRDRRTAERALRDLLAFDRLTQRRGGRAYHSTELAWITLGLIEALAQDLGPERSVRAQLDRAYRLLLQNRGRSGLVAFARSPDFIATRLRWQASLGFFDAQVYTILASLRRDALLDDPAARDVALTIGRQIMSHQGPLGQWAWHYNVDTGGLVDLYPVYSVHQDGMAPMALLPLERALGLPTVEAVARGVEWLYGNNELGVRMIELDRSIIWRSIRRREPLRRVVYPLKVASVAGLASSSLGTCLAFPSALEVDRELRPYHLGWALMAFAELVAEKPRVRSAAITDVVT